MNIFRIFKTRNAPQPEPSELDLGKAWFQRIFEPTHMHVATGKLYMLTADGERLEVTGDDAYPLAEYEDAAGKPYAQRASRFHDGRFREVTL